jgi:protein-S-isoprenylcysteine O-methyltransferase Ste14
MFRFIAFLYGLVAYVGFLGVFLYAIGFLGNFLVPKTIDSGTPGPVGQALLVNTLLLGIFAVQHSVMARPGFKKWWTQIVPKPIERSTYVLISNLLFVLLFWQWRPITTVIWQVESPAGQMFMYGLFAFGWLLVLATSFLINHFDLFGLRQVALYLIARAYKPLQFRTTAAYKYIRHPILLGWMIAFWATPTMTGGHLLFAFLTTAYMLIAIPLEERDLESFHGEIYRRYREEVPMLVPWKGAKGADLVRGSAQLSGSED